MLEENSQEKLQKNIEKFLIIYKILNPADKAAFEAQMEATIKGVDEKTRNLYKALLKSAKDYLTKDEAIEAMHKINNA